MTDRIYKVEIVAYPEGSDDYDWEPDDWNGYPGDMPGDPSVFQWPSTSHLYASRSGAMARKRLIESYGATARVLVTETEWVEERESVRRRRVARAITRANRLNDKAAAIIAEALATTEEDAA